MLLWRPLRARRRAFRSWYWVQGQSRGKEVYRLVRSYELTYIVHPEVDGDDLAAVSERVSALVERDGGKIVQTESWGLRRLAYPIQKQWEGQYVLMQLELEPRSVSALEQGLGLVEPIMRYLIVRVEGEETRPAELAAE